MAKYSGTAATRPQAALRTTNEQTVTHEGAPAWEKDAKTALFTLAVTSMTAENTFYETASNRDSRLRDLVQQVTKTDPEFIQKLVPWLRNVAQMRSAPIVIAAEYALAGGPRRRQVIDTAMERADEPAEFLGYYMQRTGRRTLPAGIQRGVADAVQRLYNEYAALKYDSSGHAIRMGDVIELAHPKAKSEWQGTLYEWLLDKRHNPTDVRANIQNLSTVQARGALEAVAPEARRALVKSGEWAEVSARAGVTWEYLSGWLPGGMDAEAWEAVIPTMGYMALLRNLRNFDQAGISKEKVDYVAEVLEDPERVAKSRQFPYRFYSAWKATQSVRWGKALEQALELSVGNVPTFDGSTLILIDASGSMQNSPSGRSQISMSEIATLFGAAMFAKNPETARVVAFATQNQEVTPRQKGSILRNMEAFQRVSIGWGTYLAQAARDHYEGEDRVVIFTDMQTHDGGVSDKAKYTHYFDLGGYKPVPDEIQGNTFMYGGFTDATFRQMALHEATARSDWETILDSGL